MSDSDLPPSARKERPLHCGKCGSPLVLLFTTAVCDACDPPGGQLTLRADASVAAFLSSFPRWVTTKVDSGPRARGSKRDLVTVAMRCEAVLEVREDMEGITRILKHRAIVPPRDVVIDQIGVWNSVVSMSQRVVGITDVFPHCWDAELSRYLFIERI